MALIIEDLKLKNLTRRAKPKIDNDGTWLRNNQAAKSGLNKSMLAAAHGQLIQALKLADIYQCQSGLYIGMTQCGLRGCL